MTYPAKSQEFMVYNYVNFIKIFYDKECGSFRQFLKYKFSIRHLFLMACKIFC